MARPKGGTLTDEHKTNIAGAMRRSMALVKPVTSTWSAVIKAVNANDRAAAHAALDRFMDLNNDKGAE